MTFFDSHCHLDAPELRRLLPGILDDAKAAGVGGFLVPGVSPDGWEALDAVCREYPCALPAFGVHPMHADLLTPAVLSELRRLSSRAAAIGEIGLDYLVNMPTREVQISALRAQLRVALEARLPVLIHCRKGFNDLLAIVREEGAGSLTGVMHAFSGSPETAAECLRLGLHISLAGSVTYANAVRPVAVAASVPLERLLLETDAPDLAPEPYRGQVNLPSHLLSTARRVAELRGISLEELGRATTENATRLFRLAPELRWPRQFHEED